MSRYAVRDIIILYPKPTDARRGINCELRIANCELLMTHLPIMIDPSHATGKSEYVPTMAMAAIASGTDSLMIEVHPNPSLALSDGPQSLTLEGFQQLMLEMALLAQFFGRWSKSPFATAKKSKFAVLS